MRTLLHRANRVLGLIVPSPKYGRQNSFRQNQQGNVAMTFALLSTTVLAAAGAGMDYAAALNMRSQLQYALDSAVLGAAISDDENKVAEASSIFSAHQEFKKINAVASSFKDEDNIVSGNASVSVSTQFLGLLGLSELEVGAKAAAAYSSSQVCILLLDKSARDAFKANGSGNINAPDCEMHVHSENRSAAYIDSKSIDPKSLCVRGEIAGNARPRPDNFEERCNVVDDSYLDKMPKSTKRLVSEKSCMTRFPDPNNSEMVFKPGTYCSWPPINGHVTSVKFTPGDYYIKSNLSVNARSVSFGDGNYVFDGANLTFNGPAKTVSLGDGLYVLTDGAKIIFNDQKVTGSDLTIYLADEQSEFLTVQGRSHATLKAPKRSRYKDILIYEAPGLRSDSGRRYNLDGEMNIEGLVYLPSRNLHFNGSGEMDGDKLTLVLNRLSLDGSISIDSGRRHPELQKALICCADA